MIRAMELADIPRILAIEDKCFSDRWGAEQYRFEIEENELSTMYVLEENNEIVAYAGYWKLFERAEVLTLAVDPFYQGQGYAKTLLKKLIQEAINNECEVISLEVRVSNYKAINLYKKYGFINMRTRKDYYPDNHEDAYEMAKALGGLNEEDICD